MTWEQGANSGVACQSAQVWNGLWGAEGLGSAGDRGAHSGIACQFAQEPGCGAPRYGVNV